MSKILAVFGATGKQGGSVIDYVLNDPELSQRFKIRAITRDVNSETSRKLKDKVQVVQGDVLDRASIETALAGAHTVFAMTKPSFGPDAFEIEYNSGKTIADVAVEKGAEYIIFSTLPSVTDMSDGKYTKVTPFDAKAKVEQYVRGLPIKSAFYAGGFFMENFHTQPFLNPQQTPDGTWVMSRANSPMTKLPYVNATRDTGKFVGAILAEPEKYQGKTFCAAVALYSLGEIAAIISKATGKPVVYKQISSEESREYISRLGPWADIYIDASGALEDFGYFGPDTEKLVAWALENARGKLSTLEEYFESNPLQLA